MDQRKETAMSEPTRTYIAGKVSELDRRTAKELFEDAEQVILIGGNIPVSPMRHIQYIEGKTWEQYMREALQLMLTCDRVLFLENWSDSPGAKMEHSIAKTLKMDISYLTKTLDKKPVIK